MTPSKPTLGTYPSIPNLIPCPPTPLHDCSISHKAASSQDLVSEKGGFVGAISGGIACATQGLHVRDSHAQDGELVWFAGQGTAGGHHIRQLCDVGSHLIPSPTFNLAVIFPAKGQGGEEEDEVTNRPEASAVSPCQHFNKARVQNTEMHQGHQELEGLQAPHMLGVHKGTQEQVQGGQPTVGPSLLWTRASL